MEDCNTCGKPNCKMGYPTPIGFKLFCCSLCANHYMNYPLDYPLELDSPEHYVFESEDLEEGDIIPIGSTIRSYDFIVGKHILRDDCYFEGVIEKFEPVPTCSPDCNHYIVRTTKIVRNGEEEDIIEGSNDYFSTHWNNYGVIPLEMADVLEAETYTPPAAAIKAAKKGLSQRKKWGRGGLSPAEAKSQGIDSGVTRARKIASGKVSRHDVRRMSAFNRHRKNNKPSKKMPDGGPTAGTIAWNLWGGSAGVNWAKKKSAAMNAETFEAENGFIFSDDYINYGMGKMYEEDKNEVRKIFLETIKNYLSISGYPHISDDKITMSLEMFDSGKWRGEAFIDAPISEMNAEDRPEEERMTRAEAEALAAKMINLLQPYADSIDVCGSYRRGREDPGDLDIVVILKPRVTLPEIVEDLEGEYTAVNWVGEKKTQMVIDGVKVDVRTTTPRAKGAALLYFTGPAGYNIGIRRSAKSRGMKLNEYGIFDRETNEYLGGATEEEIYEILGKNFRPATERRAEEEEVVTEIVSPLNENVTRSLWEIPDNVLRYMYRRGDISKMQMEIGIGMKMQAEEVQEFNAMVKAPKGWSKAGITEKVMMMEVMMQEARLQQALLELETNIRLGIISEEKAMAMFSRLMTK